MEFVDQTRLLSISPIHIIPAPEAISTTPIKSIDKVSSNYTITSSSSKVSPPMVRYSSASITVAEAEAPQNRRRFYSADSAGNSRFHAPSMTYASSPKMISSSANTSSALVMGGQIWAAFGLLGSSPSSRPNASSPSTQKSVRSSGSPYGPQPPRHASSSPGSKPRIQSDASSPSTQRIMQPSPSFGDSDEDFVLVDRLPNRPWRAIETMSVSARDLDIPSSPVEEKQVSYFVFVTFVSTFLSLISHCICDFVP